MRPRAEASLELSTPNQVHGEHWRTRAPRVADQRARTKRAVRKWLELNGPRLTITVVRVSPRRVDQPNLGAALKAVIDGIADALCLDDRAEWVDWKLQQRKGSPARVEWSMEWDSSQHQGAMGL